VDIYWELSTFSSFYSPVQGKTCHPSFESGRSHLHMGILSNRFSGDTSFGKGIHVVSPFL